MRRFKFLLLLWDGIWSVPLAFLLFLGIGLVGQRIFGFGFGFYDPAFWQAAIMAIGVLIMFNTAVWLGMYFNFRGLFRYRTGVRHGETIKNHSKDDFLKITSWQRLVILLLVYFFQLVLLVVLFKILA